MAACSATADRVAAARDFTRFYTNKIGVLRGGLHGSRHALPDARVLFELGRADVTPVSDLRRALNMDAGQLSRLLARLDEDGLIARERSDQDARRQVLRLTAAGHAEFQRLDHGARDQWSELLAGLPEAQQARLLVAMRTVQAVLDGALPTGAGRADVTLRGLRSGDLGWIVARHGVLYAEQFGWGPGFEALCARVVVDYAEQEDQHFRRGWIAEVHGAPAGCVLCVDGEQEGDAKLRLLLVEPWARGLGVGGQLVDAVIDHARERGAHRIVLWTNHPLLEARRLYVRRGFELVAEKPHADWGVPLTGQVLALPL